MKRAVFLDRDGTINVDTHYPHAPGDLSLIAGAEEALAILADLPIHIIVVTNQAGIPLGYFTQDQMSAFNLELRVAVERSGGRIDAFYFCPHLEAKHLPAGVTPHQCVKPSPGMLLEAARDYALELSKCFAVGDKTSDIAAGAAVGCTTVLVRTGKGGREEDALPVEPTYEVDHLWEAALLIRSNLKDACHGE